LIDEYLVVGKLGEGGFGTVYLTLQIPIMMKTALKLLKNLARQGVDQVLLAEKFETEAQALATLTHPNIVRLIKYGAFERIPYMVMEYVDQGRNLQEEVVERVTRGRPFEIGEVRHIVTRLLHALAAAHARSLVHRDIKPENIMLQRVEGDPLFVRVLDFGLAKVVSKPAETTMVQGTPTYMAPEQLRGKNIGPWTDLYAVGIIFFELLTGRRLFSEKSSHEMFAHKLDPEYRPLNHVTSVELPAYAMEFFDKATHPDAQIRFQSATEFMEAMHRMLDLLEQERGAAFSSGVRDLVRSSEIQGTAFAETALPISGMADTVLAQPGDSGLVSAPAVASTQLATGSSATALVPRAKPVLTRAVLALLLLAVLGGGGYFGLRALGVFEAEQLPARLRLATTPPGAEVLAGEESLGTTPLDVELTPGTHVITIRKPGFKEHSVSRDYRSGQTDSFEVILERVEFRANAHTENRQEKPWTDAFADGRFVVVWGSANQDDSPSSVFGRLFDTLGSPIGDEFQLNTHTQHKQGDPSVGTFSDGRFVAVWESLMQDGDGWGLFGQLFDQDAKRIGSEFRVNTHLASNQEMPRVRVLNDGRFVVVWQSEHQDGSGHGIFGQLFTSAGQPAGSEFQANSHVESEQQTPAVAAFGRGGFVVVWESKDQDGSSHGVFGQRYDSDGNPAGGEFQANAQTEGWQRWPAVGGAADGRFVVVWTADGQDSHGFGVFGQFFNSDGTRHGKEFQANTHTKNNQWVPSLAAFRDGRFVAVWISEGQAGPGFGLFGQVFHADGTPIGGEFQVHTLPSDEKVVRSIAALDPNRFVTVWESAGAGGGGLDVYARIMEVPR